MTTSTTTKTLAAAGALALLGVGAGPASGAVIEHHHFVNSGSEVFDFCPGIDAEISWKDRVHELIRSQGRDGLVYFKANVHGTTVFTNLDTGGTYTNTYNFTDKDLKVVDNGDGTLTITIASSGSFKWYDADGNRVLKGAGQFRAELTVDHGGTPTDPSDDVEVDFVVVKLAGQDQTDGRDFCEDLAEFTT
jgi:hypothetical protein